MAEGFMQFLYIFMFLIAIMMTEGMTISVENISIDRIDHLAWPNIVLPSTLDVIDIELINKTRE